MSRIARERDVLRELCESAPSASMCGWCCCTTPGSARPIPSSCVTNAFGDRYVYNLCPAAPAARDYALGLCQDVTDNYPVRGLSLETPGFLPYAHGFHHEFALIKWNRWLENQLGLCFCEHCVKGAAQAGIDAASLSRRVRDDVEVVSVR